MSFLPNTHNAEGLPRSRRDPGYAYPCMEEEGDCDDDEDDDVDDDEDHDDDEEEDEDGVDGDTYDDEDDMEGFEDWRMEDELADRHGPAAYDDEGDWNPDVQEDLPELIYTEGCDDEGVDLAPCISLQRCSNRIAGMSTRGGADGTGGDVDAVRVMLLGVSDSGRPSVGIDLGYACTQQNSPNTTRDSATNPLGANSGRSTNSPHANSSGSDSPAPSAGTSPHRDANSSGASEGRAGGDGPQQSSPTALSPTMMSRATTRASRPASPFVFQPPRTPSRAAAAPARRSFVFSEWASSNKQTFVFEGAQRDGTDPDHLRRHSPCKFVPTKALTLAMQDADFVGKVLADLPGVETSDPRIISMLDRIREGRTTRPQTPSAAGEGEKLSRSMSSIRPAFAMRPPSARSLLGSRSSSCRNSVQGPLTTAAEAIAPVAVAGTEAT